MTVSDLKVVIIFCIVDVVHEKNGTTICLSVTSKLSLSLVLSMSYMRRTGQPYDSR